VAEGAAETRAPGARDMRASLLIPAISSVIVGGDLFPCYLVCCLDCYHVPIRPKLVVNG